ncbi:unnamed protein product, partial [Colletotrichum noveboracense]
FISKVLSDTFKPADALNLLRNFFLNFFSIIGKLGRLIMRRSAPLLDNIIILFKRYGAPYSAKYVGGVPFNMTGRTFRIAQAGMQEVWFIVMHPLAGDTLQLIASAAGHSQQEAYYSCLGRVLISAGVLVLAFHAYNYGANLEIKVGEEIFDLLRETHAFRESDSKADISQDDEDEEAGDAVADNIQYRLDSLILNESKSEGSRPGTTT